MAPAAPAADKLTPEEVSNAASLYNADVWARENAQGCWADHPNIGAYGPLTELACNGEVEGCSLGLCDRCCKEVH
jgi:hypothetical protein